MLWYLRQTPESWKTQMQVNSRTVNASGHQKDKQCCRSRVEAGTDVIYLLSIQGLEAGITTSGGWGAGAVILSRSASVECGLSISCWESALLGRGAEAVWLLVRWVVELLAKRAGSSAATGVVGRAAGVVCESRILGTVVGGLTSGGGVHWRSVTTIAEVSAVW